MVCDFRALISPHIQICRSTVGIMSLRFNSDGTFRVLQMADIQDGPDAVSYTHLTLPTKA